MAWVAILAHGAKFGVGVICPYIGRLHSGVSVLAICNRVPGEPAHKVHFPHTTPGVLNKPQPRGQGHYEPVNVKVYAIAKLRVIRNRG